MGEGVGRLTVVSYVVHCMWLYTAVSLYTLLMYCHYAPKIRSLVPSPRSTYIVELRR